MPSPLGEGQTVPPKNRHYQGEVVDIRPRPFFICIRFHPLIRYAKRSVDNLADASRGRVSEGRMGQGTTSLAIAPKRLPCSE